MAILDELLVRLGIDADGLSSGAKAAASDVENSLSGVGDAGRQAGQEAARGVQEVADSLTEVGSSAEEAAGDAQQAADNTEQSFRGMAMAAAGAAAGAAFIGALTDAMDAQAATAKLKAQLGLSGAEAERAGRIAGDVFSAGFGGAIDEVTGALGSVTSAMGDLGDFTDAELQQMTKSAIGLGDTFEMDVGEAATAAGQLIKQGLVKDGTEAFDVLTAAAGAFPQSMAADLPAVVADYGIHFKRIGLDAKTAFGLMSQYVAAGGRDVDQAGDILHEFARITSEETDRAAQGFKDLGLDSKQMLADIGKGGKPAAAALEATLDELRKVEAPAERAQLAVALFGDMAGEAGDALLAMDPATAAAASGMDKTAGASQALTDAMQGSAAQQLDAIMRTLSATIGEALAPALSAVAGLAAEHPAVFKGIAIAVVFLAAALAIGAAAQWAMNAAFLANPIMWVVIAVAALIAIIVLIATKTTWFQDLWHGMTSGIASAWSWLTGILSAGFSWLVGAIGTAFGWVADISSAAWDGITDVTSAAWDWIVNLIEAGINMALGIIRSLATWPGIVGGFFARMASAAGDKIGALIGFVRSIPGRVKSAVGSLGSLLLNAGRNIIRGLINGVTSMIGALRSKFSAITSMIPDWKGPMTVDLHLLEPSGEALMGGLMDGIAGSEDALQRQLAGITSSIPSNVNASVTSAGASGRGGRDDRLIIDVTGSDEHMKALIRNIVRVDGHGDVQTAFT